MLLRTLMLAALVPAVGSAAELELNYDAVTFIRDVAARPVLDNEAHVVGTGAFRGIATFTDGAVAVHRYDGWFDLVDGVGPFHGYALWVFEDGSELRAEYEGGVTGTTANGVTFHADFTSVSGSGRFEGATGNGSFDGRRFEPLEVGGVAKLSGVLNVTVAD